MAEKYAYRYVDTNGQPLKACPECGHDLTGEGGVGLSVVVGGVVNRDLTSSLDEQGYLEDTEDGAVAHGFHSDTRCEGCGESLEDMEGVEEIPEVVAETPPPYALVETDEDGVPRQVILVSTREDAIERGVAMARDDYELDPDEVRTELELDGWVECGEWTIAVVETTPGN